VVEVGFTTSYLDHTMLALGSCPDGDASIHGSGMDRSGQEEEMVADKTCRREAWFAINRVNHSLSRS